ncbi:vWA domain-containing protein [Leptolyngbya sp. AN03gr2]|uniref:vWA domain-containing protein n=1 Tax=unclassified Leptolyngbya TaxID=2650499 RepID=UPI003D31700D
MKKQRFRRWFALALSFTLLWACSPNSSVNSPEEAYQHLKTLVSGIQVRSALIPDSIARQMSVPPLNDALPSLDSFPLYGAKPDKNAKTVYLEILSSTEKGNADRENERWLVEVAEAFNRQQARTNTGELIQVGIRSIPSGIGAKLIAAKAAQPAGYSPSSLLWSELLKQEGITPIVIKADLMPDCGGFVIAPQAYQQLASGGKVSFTRLLDAILTGQLKLGYANPYSSSSSLNLLYSIFWHAAGHDRDSLREAPKDRKLLTVNDVQLPQVTSVFDAFQKQVVITGVTSRDLSDAFLQDSSQLQVFASGCRGYTQLKQVKGYEKIGFVPYGVPHNNPLLGFDWNTPAQREALAQFAEFATSAPQQSLSDQQGTMPTDLLKSFEFLPTPSGDVIKAAQSVWKQRKDGGRTVYMQLVVDTSGSMETDRRLKSVQQALRLASREINRGNQVGLLTFSNQTTRWSNLAPFNELEQKRLIAAIDQLRPDGNTALYDALAVGLLDLMEKQKSDPDGRFYLLLLTDGERTDGLQLDQIKSVIQHSGVKIYPLAYGEVNQQELQEIAAIREGKVFSGTPETVQSLLKDLLQTNL